MPSVLHRLARWAQEFPETPAQRFKRKGNWEPISAKEYCDRVYQLALFLESKGMSSSSVGCIFSPNCPQWAHLDLGVLLLGAKSAGIYPNSLSKDVLYILNHTEAKVLGVKDKEFFDKISTDPASAPVLDRLDLIVVFEGDAGFHPKAVSYEKAMAEGKKIAGSKGARKLSDYLNGIDPDAPAFMIYTSGTTGNPKGALLSHDNLVFTADIVAKYWKLPMARGSLFSFLPLCHVAEKLQNIGVGISQRYRIDFCTKFDNVSVELPEVQPTLLLSVPRLWEKMMEGVINKIDRSPEPRRKLANWALAVGGRVAQAKYSGKTPSPLDRIQLKVADRLVLGKVRHALGLGKAEMLASGAAALAGHISVWFRSIGLEILEDFGQTESTGVICMTEPGVESAGTVGRPVPGLEMKIAEDGEILTRGRHVFKGYFKDLAATEQALEGGWLHTGDLGEITEKGLVRIRGRKKEVLKTSGGKMVAPLPIEEALKAAPMISQVCMVGDGRKYLSALITLSESVLDEVKKKIGTSEADVITHPEVISDVKKHIDELNKSLANFEQIKKFSILSKEFSISDGEMTPTLKMKRNVIETRYKNLIDQMYS